MPDAGHFAKGALARPGCQGYALRWDERKPVNPTKWSPPAMRTHLPLSLRSLLDLRLLVSWFRRDRRRGQGVGLLLEGMDDDA